MPNRILNSSVCTSDSIEELTFFQEAFFYRLLVTVDDYGNFDARPKVIRAAAFPLKEISLEDIEMALDAFENQGMLQRYSVKGKNYIHLANWSRFQRMRTSRHKYPAYDCEDAEIDETEIEDIEAEDESEKAGEKQQKISETAYNKNLKKQIENKEKSDSDNAVFNDNPPPLCNNSPQLAATRGERATDGGNLRLAHAKNPNPNPNPNPNTKKNLLIGQKPAERSLDDFFSEFWNEYPRKVGKPKAKSAYERALRDGTSPDEVLSGLRKINEIRWSKLPNSEKQFIPHPSTWLNQRRWDDDVEPYRPPRTPNANKKPELGLSSWISEERKAEYAKLAEQSKDAQVEDVTKWDGTGDLPF